MKTSNIIIAIAGIVGVFVLGFLLSENKVAIKEQATQIAIDTVVDQIKSDAKITQEWWNGVKGQWKSIWG